MRELKYRAWDKRTNQMRPVAEISFGDDGSARTILACMAPKNSQYWQTENVIVHSESGALMQYTGLKDRNEREIYEGDILRAYPYGWPDNGGWPFDDQRTCIYTVAWSDYEGGWIMQDERPIEDSPALYSAGIHSRRDERLEIVGNIHENPELLEQQS